MIADPRVALVSATKLYKMEKGCGSGWLEAG